MCQLPCREALMSVTEISKFYAQMSNTVKSHVETINYRCCVSFQRLFYFIWFWYSDWMFLSFLWPIKGKSSHLHHKCHCNPYFIKSATFLFTNSLCNSLSFLSYLFFLSLTIHSLQGLLTSFWQVTQFSGLEYPMSTAFKTHEKGWNCVSSIWYNLL